jgi:hypothetical protein
MELMDNQKFGISQFAEQVNYQRGLEGELARSIESIGAVQSARVHLAIPKPTLFVRERQKPTASVVLQLYPGRAVDEGQVAAITHLVSSSVPELTPKSISIVDQHGNLLSGTSDRSMDASQLKYVQQVEQATSSAWNRSSRRSSARTTSTPRSRPMSISRRSNTPTKASSRTRTRPRPPSAASRPASRTSRTARLWVACPARCRTSRRPPPWPR